MKQKKTPDYYVFESEEVGIFAVQAKTFGEAKSIAYSVASDAEYQHAAYEWDIDAMGLDVF